jgi:hypothetical protein
MTMKMTYQRTLKLRRVRAEQAVVDSAVGRAIKQSR